ncbi:YrhC family protein [Natribacillus halophilus]|uniref:YrhC-like protein n=1 Tax=Natribacillus halophilus TaxID=549003 RepID=A0A1G8P0Z8_9BACI|nr:YrhC family protein [Natribacillus halophilus]SDI86172.1 YrhC-like protein [Natribacillus halophilus]
MEQTKQEQKFLTKINDYRSFAHIFLLLAAFMSIGWLIPEQADRMRSMPALFLWFGLVGASVFCLSLSLKWRREWENS